jgi:hypothetical protein
MTSPSPATQTFTTTQDPNTRTKATAPKTSRRPTARAEMIQQITPATTPTQGDELASAGAHVQNQLTLTPRVRGNGSRSDVENALGSALSAG